MDAHPVPLSYPYDGAPADLIDALRGLGRVRRLAARQVVVPEGRRPGFVSVVEAGVLSLSVTTATGSRVVLSVVGRGEIVGEQALLDASSDDPDGTDLLLPECRAMTASRVLDLVPGELARAFHGDADLAEWLAASLVRRIGELHRSLTRALSLRLADRTLDLLVALSRHRWGRRTEPPDVTVVPLTQEDLASMLGATRESVNRAVRQLERTGAVSRVGRRYRVRPGLRTGPGPPPGRNGHQGPGPPAPRAPA